MRGSVLKGTSAVVLALLIAYAIPGALEAASDEIDQKVTDHPYTRLDGGSDDVLAFCSDDTSSDDTTTADDKGGNRQQNEPTIAVNPSHPTVLAAGANDYCTFGTTGDAWAGFYWTDDGGASWRNSLLPGYPGDTSPAGRASPLNKGGFGAAGDPVMAWDTGNYLFYGGIAFDRGIPAGASFVTRSNFGGVWVATYRWNAATSEMEYLRTVLVASNTPGNGLFQDKTAIQTDQWALSPHKDNVYFTWSRFQGFGNNAIYVSRSTDHGATFSKPIKISDGIHGNQTTDIAVAPNGDVYVTWRQFNDPSPQDTAIVFSKSTDGGLTWSKPRIITEIDPFDSREFSGSNARDCGDGPFACPTGFVFHRQSSQPSIAANAAGVYVVYNEEQPSGQSKVMFTRSIDGGATWSTPIAIDPATTVGHEWWPDIAATDILVGVAYYTSRDDTGYAASRPPCNSTVGTSTCSGSSGVNVYYAQSTDNGANWDAPIKISDQAHNPNYEMFGNRDVPFHGDYIYISMTGTSIYVAWTDNRDVVTGTDPRYSPPDGTDGFDVLQCRVPATSPDNCPNKGGLNQNIYATKVTP
ncbi:MAG TPA: sialidase family protein [bacterium]|nr:sialidase family protein [bacterium]